jgi:hypothetical protein
MTQTSSITCDYCKGELVENSAYPHKYALQLKSIDTIASTSGVKFAIMMYPPLDSDKHFCDFKCLKDWLEDEGKLE